MSLIHLQPEEDEHDVVDGEGSRDGGHDLDQAGHQDARSTYTEG